MFAKKKIHPRKTPSIPSQSQSQSHIHVYIVQYMYIYYRHILERGKKTPIDMLVTLVPIFTFTFIIYQSNPLSSPSPLSSSSNARTTGPSTALLFLHRATLRVRA